MSAHQERSRQLELSRLAAERYAQLTAVAEQRASRSREPHTRRLLRLVRAKLA